MPDSPVSGHGDPAPSVGDQVEDLAREADRGSRPKTNAEMVADSLSKRFAAGAKRLPAMIVDPDVREIAERLVDARYGGTMVSVVSRALREAGARVLS